MVEKVGIEPTCPKATGLQPAALPLEHLLHLLCGKGDWTRTNNRQDQNLMLYQLSYTPTYL